MIRKIKCIFYVLIIVCLFICCVSAYSGAHASTHVSVHSSSHVTPHVATKTVTVSKASSGAPVTNSKVSSNSVSKASAVSGGSGTSGTSGSSGSSSAPSVSTTTVNHYYNNNYESNYGYHTGFMGMGYYGGTSIWDYMLLSSIIGHREPEAYQMVSGPNNQTIMQQIPVQKTASPLGIEVAIFGIIGCVLLTLRRK